MHQPTVERGTAAARCGIQVVEHGGVHGTGFHHARRLVADAQIIDVRSLAFAATHYSSSTVCGIGLLLALATLVMGAARAQMF